MNAIELSIFSSQIGSVCEEMGAVLRRAAFSPNIKDRLDFSCAVFDAAGELCAQAAHIPVHLGSMAYAMRDVVNRFDWQPGDMAALNDPYMGGTHLPDVTLLAPVFCDDQLVGFVANRAHHADIGAESPGSMPISATLEEEGVIISPQLLLAGGQLAADNFQRLLGAMHNRDESEGDFTAQISANQRGVARLSSLIDQMGRAEYRAGLQQLNDYGERLSRQLLDTIPQGRYQFSDLMDDDGLGQRDIPIRLTLTVRGDGIVADFSGTAAQVPGNINCPLSVAAAAVYYVFRCLLPTHAPACAGLFRLIELRAPLGCLVNAQTPAAVAAGNVETSTRIVDVVMGALAQALPDRIPAASHGSMNNLAMGSRDSKQGWDYYETIGGGMGGSPVSDGLDAVQTHMTNTLNTPIEALEMRFPLRIRRYAVRRGSGGNGAHRGGNGLVREIEFLAPAQATLLTERRSHAPWGLAGGDPGQPGQNWLNQDSLPGKASVTLQTGDRLCIESPGGGGWGNGNSDTMSNS